MLISCDNKGCFKTSNALYDQENGNVICQECGNNITNISQSMKRTLVSFGQIVRTDQRKGFLMACKHCNANRQVVLSQHNKTICKQCHNPIAVQKAFLSAMESTGALERVQVDNDESKSESKSVNSPMPQARKVIKSSMKSDDNQNAASKKKTKKKKKKTTKKKSNSKKKTTQRKG